MNFDWLSNWAVSCGSDKDCANVECVPKLLKDYRCGCYVKADIVDNNKIISHTNIYSSSNSKATWEECNKIKCIPYCDFTLGRRCDCK